LRPFKGAVVHVAGSSGVCPIQAASRVSSPPFPGRFFYAPAVGRRLSRPVRRGARLIGALFRLPKQRAAPRLSRKGRGTAKGGSRSASARARDRKGAEQPRRSAPGPEAKPEPWIARSPPGRRGCARHTSDTRRFLNRDAPNPPPGACGNSIMTLYYFLSY
jgi:hypothetical protein